jgi:hypothetical protein
MTFFGLTRGSKRRPKASCPFLTTAHAKPHESKRDGKCESLQRFEPSIFDNISNSPTKFLDDSNISGGNRSYDEELIEDKTGVI